MESARKIHVIFRLSSFLRTVGKQRIRWLYGPGELTPSARFERGKLHYIVSDRRGRYVRRARSAGLGATTDNLRQGGTFSGTPLHSSGLSG
ncbi:hypothetical protein XBKB1_1370023 [Xenorhabdus bovienii str. kraussei Becker Underwood]|uniref:Uncharacterized protein n=1 Tax=Xenorhabdus bovienii str. kraussei Becker Underwood TaxID=1398204 RepID=A0A077PQM3_XENBV|nr:hypothetical protein XBKB1_1370023 [Xenorhabdus bovienii str. kraussei Becker Underwood]